jgi:uncharacterized protein (DUF1697 family)
MKSEVFSYTALIRGIMPTNPNTRNDKLRKLFEELGFTDVQTIISSGNVIFKSKIKDSTMIENKIEKAMADELAFKNPVMVRSKEELEKIIKRDPFKGKEHTRNSYLVVTFTKKKPRELFASIDMDKEKGASFMTAFEKKYGKEITTRTWKTVERIVKKMSVMTNFA